MGFLTLLPLLAEEGRVKFTGVEVAEAPILFYLWDCDEGGGLSVCRFEVGCRFGFVNRSQWVAR